MIDRIQDLPERRQKFVRALAVSIEGPHDRPSPLAPIILIGVLLWALYEMFH